MSEIETGGQEPEFAAFVGIDWADRKHVSAPLPSYGRSG